MRHAWLFGLSLLPQVAGVITSLDGFRDRARPLLIFSADEEDARFAQQTMILATHVDGLVERQVVGIGMPLHGDQAGLDTRIWNTAFPDEIARERRRFHVAPHAFVVVLIGKDGGEKMRWTRPVSFEELRAVIDAMPGRQDEVRQQGTKVPPKS